MTQHAADRPQLAFALVPMQASHLTDIATWKDMEPIRRNKDAYVMTLNGRPIFCIQLRRWRESDELVGSGYRHLQMLLDPYIRQNGRLLLLAWQAASTFVFLRLGIDRVEVVVNADDKDENEVLFTLGYRLVGTSHSPGGRRHMYRCAREGFKVVM